MKRCPECGRNYNDDSLSFCLDDGSELLFGPANEPATAIFPGGSLPSEAGTRAQFSTTGQTAILPRRGFDRRLVVAGFLVAIVGIGGFFGYRYLRPSGDQIASVAVMPFRNESGNPDLEYLSDGITDTLITTLSQLRNLSVKAHSSVFRYKGKDVDPQTIGRDLNVQAVVNGRVAQRGDQLTLTLDLVNAQTENVIWSRQYTRGPSDLVSLQTEIARDLSSKLKTKLRRGRAKARQNLYD